MRILLVEDDKNQRLLYQLVLSEEGYTVVEANDGIMGLEIFEREAILSDPFDLLIVDINMPRMDGLEMMGRILKNYKDTPIIINTAYTSYKDDLISRAADAYINKSSDLTELKNKIKELLKDKLKKKL